MKSPLVSLERFHQEVQGHRERVHENADQVLYQFGQDFPALMTLASEPRKRLFSTYMSLHDAPKVMTDSELRRWGYKHKKTILEKLHEIYGVSLSERPWYINEMNSMETKIKQVTLDQKFLFLKDDLKRRVQRELRYIEWVADLTDTFRHRGTELGTAFDLGSANRYFLRQNDPQAAGIASWLGLGRLKV